MGETNTASTLPHMAPYQTIRDRGVGTVHNTELLVLEAIRKSHPDSHVTAAASKYFDIHGWAGAGNAEVKLHHHGDLYSASRRFKAAANKVNGESGTLDQAVSFGLHSLIVEGVEWQFYVAEWCNNLFGNTKRFFFMLSDRSNVDENGNSASADELLLAIGNWTARLHNEIWVFDQANWDKDARLWKAIKKSKWDDIILDPTMKERLLDDVCSFFNNRSSYQQYGVPWKRDIILHGEPGCGKTMSIKALVNMLDERKAGAIPSLVVKSFDDCRGEGLQYSIKSIFSQARDMAPCLLILEDLDSLVVDKVRSYFLNEVDGLEDFPLLL